MQPPAPIQTQLDEKPYFGYSLNLSNRLRMKRMDLFCSSQASTAICSSIDQRSMVRNGIRSIDRRINDLRDLRNNGPPIPCSSRLPISPKPYHEKSRSSCAKLADTRTRKSYASINDPTTSPPGSSRYLLGDATFFDSTPPETEQFSALVPYTQQSTRSKHMASHGSPVLRKSSSTHSHDQVRKNSAKQADAVNRKSCANRYYFNISPSGSPRHPQTSDSPVFGSAVSEDEPFSALIPYTHHQSSRAKHVVSSNGSPVLTNSSSTRKQVVDLWVSLHCKGCAGKVRKHIEKMEGVTSFSIDLATKKVTVVGDVTPLGVLASVSKVKTAQLWPTQASITPVVDLRY